MPRLLYAVPTGGHPKMAWAQSYASIQMRQTSCSIKSEDMMATSAPVQMARSEILRQSVARGYDYVVMHDDDLEVSDGTLNPIDEAIKAMEADRTIGLYGLVYLREAPLVPLLVVKHPEYETVEHCQVISGLPADPFDVWGMGFGWVCIRVSILDRMAELDMDIGGARPLSSPVRWGIRPDISGACIEVGEDYDFCDRVHEAGYRVVADPRFSTVHHKATGRLIYNHDEWERRTHQEKYPRLTAYEYAPRYVVRDPSDVGQTVVTAYAMGYKDAAGEWHELPERGELLTAESHKVECPEGTTVITIDGMACLDITAVRFARAKELRQQRDMRRLAAGEFAK